jgi:hypothetical protein
MTGTMHNGVLSIRPRANKARASERAEQVRAEPDRDRRGNPPALDSATHDDVRAVRFPNRARC